MRVERPIITGYHERVMRSERMRAAVIAIGLLVAFAGRFAALPASVRIHTEDSNRDGRPDLWEYYDGRGELVRKSIDTNFDGRSDVQEAYQDRHLVRRESDRNFDDRVDLTEEFDNTTGEHQRSIVDVDFDGRADLLVLFARGEPVVSEWARENSSITIDPVPSGRGRSGDESLRRFANPFSTALRFQSAAPHARTLASADSPSVPVAARSLLASTEIVAAPRNRSVSPASRPVAASKPRGPPATSNLA